MQYINFFDFGISMIIQSSLQWLANQINNMIDTHRSDLESKKLGAIRSSKDPKVVWVSMIERPKTGHQ